jgi:hypothetical protein
LRVSDQRNPCRLHKQNADSLLAEDLVEPGSFVTPYPILHFFAEYDAPSRRPSGMFGCVQWSCSFRTGTDDEVLCSAERSGHPASRGVKGLPSHPWQ